MTLLTKVFLVVLGMSLTGAVFILLIKLVNRLFRRRMSKKLAYGLWILAVLKLLAPLNGEVPAEAPDPVMYQYQAFAGEYLTTDYVEVRRPTPYQEAYLAEREQEALERQANQPTWVQTSTPPMRRAREIRTDPQNIIERRLRNARRTAQRLLTDPDFYVQTGSVIWLSGAVLTLGLSGIRYRRFRRVVGASWQPVAIEALQEQFEREKPARSKARLGQSEIVSSPLLVGLRKPLLILPAASLAKLAADEEESVAQGEVALMLRHELVHLRRGDVLGKWLLQLVCSIHWFNPAVHALRRFVEQDCELACDEQVCQGLSATERQQYGNVLLAVAATGSEKSSTWLCSTMSANGKKLKERLMTVKGVRKQRLWERVLCLLTVLLLCGLSVAVKPVSVSLAGTESETVSLWRKVNEEEQFFDELVCSLVVEEDGIQFTVPEQFANWYEVRIGACGRKFEVTEKGFVNYGQNQYFDVFQEINAFSQALYIPLSADEYDDYVVSVSLQAFLKRQERYELNLNEGGFRALGDQKLYGEWDWAAAYQEVLNNRWNQLAARITAIPEEQTLISYGLLDADQDGQPELFVRNEISNSVDVYTIRYGRVKYLGRMWGTPVIALEQEPAQAVTIYGQVTENQVHTYIWTNEALLEKGDGTWVSAAELGEPVQFQQLSEVELGKIPRNLGL